MAAKKSGLGKGLDALFPGEKTKSRSTDQNNKENNNKKEESKTTETKTNNPDTKPVNGQGVVMVKLSSVEPNNAQPRKKFDEDALYELSESIKQYGIIQPIIVSNKGDYYIIIAGERRWRAAKMAGIKEIPVIIKEFSDQEIVEVSLIENIQREDLNPIEEAKAYKRLIEEYNLKQDEIAERVSKSRVAISNSMRLLKLDERVQDMLIDEMITPGHARALLSLDNLDLQYDIAQQIFDQKISVREVEKMVKNITDPRPERKKETDPKEDVIYQQLEERLKRVTGTKVTIKRKNQNKGRVEIEYYSQSDLERIMELIDHA